MAEETKTIGKYLIEIIHEDSPESPREWDNMGTMVCFHNSYNLGDKHDYDYRNYDGWEELRKGIEKDNDVAVILHLFLYDHSGITISTTPFGCRWDSGQIGWIFVTKDKVREQFNKKRITKKVVEEMTKYLTGEVETYDQYLRGDIYGYRVSQLETCSLGHTHKEELDSCWGFYGQDVCMEEAESIVKYYVEKDAEQPTEQLVASE